MVRVGLIRFFITAMLKPENGGKTSIILALTPEAKTYRVLTNEWHGTRNEEVERDFSLSTFMVKRAEYSYELKLHQVARYSRELASELASTVVTHCIHTGLVNWNDCTKVAAIWLVETALLNAVRDGINETVQQSELIDLAIEMRAMKAEREREQREREAALLAQAQQHMLDQQLATVRALEVAEGARKRSFELLHQYLTQAEKKELHDSGQVTVKTLMGDFVVPILAHGLVRQYVDGKYKESFCIVFEDSSIPVGDEALMKIALLKIDPQRFMNTANRFHMPVYYR